MQSMKVLVRLSSRVRYNILPGWLHAERGAGFLTRTYCRTTTDGENSDASGTKIEGTSSAEDYYHHSDENFAQRHFSRETSIIEGLELEDQKSRAPNMGQQQKYFQTLVTHIQNAQQNSDSISHSVSLTTEDRMEDLPENLQTDKYSRDSEVSFPMNVDLKHIKPALPRTSSNLAAYANESEVLSNFVKLGVDLSKVEDKNRDAANYFLKMDFEADVKPYLTFLHKVGVPDRELGNFITKNPAIFQESLEDLEIRVNYLESKRFTPQEISRIITKAPLVLSRSTKALDTQLGFLQKEFRLSGDEVRTAVTRLPKLTTFGRLHIQDIKLSMNKFLGFTEPELKRLLIALPKVFLMGKHGLMGTFDYIHNEIGLTHRQILEWPNVLRTRRHITKQHYEFLKHIGRAQLDPTKENYVSMKSLITGTDAKFCKYVAKVPVQNFNDFMKTL